MTSTALEPFLVSDVPPASVSPSALERLRARLVIRLAARRFEHALRHASPQEFSDLIALSRRD